MGAAPALLRADLVAAHARLRGQLVAAPVIGGLDLPGFTVPADLRLKAELLQPSGSLWFRGAMHWAMRQLGRHKGITIDGPARRVLAWACAAREARIAAWVPRAAELPPQVRAALVHFGCAEVRDDRGSGFVPAPGLDAPDFRLGVASIALELLEELPRDTRRVVVAPAALAEIIAAGVAGVGAAWQVVAGAERDGRAAEVQATLLGYQRLACDLEGAAALASSVAAGESGTCVLLGV